MLYISIAPSLATGLAGHWHKVKRCAGIETVRWWLKQILRARKNHDILVWYNSDTARINANQKEDWIDVFCLRFVLSHSEKKSNLNDPLL